jgi:poly(hydroxyalkanoate) depolymerase family esterase
MNRNRRTRLLLGLLLLTPLVTVPARAASLQAVDQSEWWAGVDGLPSYVNMFIYVPDQLASKPPIVVATHHCQGTGQSTYSEMSGLVRIADSSGFIMVFPEATGENCWDAGSPRSLSHGGGGDTGAIVQMVKYTLDTYDGDAGRVYTVGGSSGGIMTEALLGVYPDVFMAGVSLMGVPCGCWGEQYNDVTGNGSTAQWSGPCAGGNVNKTGAEWGDLVKSFYPGYDGHRPRLQHWHGDADTTLNFKNVAEDVKEWTNLLGLDEMPTGSDTPANGTTHQYWENSCGFVVYETFVLAGVGHSVPFDANAVAKYFGLDTPGEADPEVAACGAPPGSGGAPGIGGSSNAGSSNAGSGNAGAMTGTGGSTEGSSGSGAGGAPVAGAGGTTGVSGTTGSGGQSSGGAAPAGGESGGGLDSAAGTSNLPAPAPGGSGAPPGGTGATPAPSATPGGTTPTTGAGATPAAPSAPGSAGPGVSPTAASAGPGGSASSAPTTNADTSNASGCACALVSRSSAPLPSLAAMLFFTLSLVGRRRRYSRSRTRAGAPRSLRRQFSSPI